MLNSKDSALLESLGRFPPDQKRVFILRASRTLQLATDFEFKLPTATDARVLARVAKHSAALARAIALAPESAKYWLKLGINAGSPNLPPPDDPACVELPRALAWVQWLAESAEVVVEKRSGGRPVTADRDSWLVREWAGDYWETFGKVPGTGEGSPFVRFCLAALAICNPANFSTDFDKTKLPERRRVRRLVSEAARHFQDGARSVPVLVYKPEKRGAKPT